MSQNFSLSVDRKDRDVDVDPDMPLLYALRNDIGLSNPHFARGLEEPGRRPGEMTIAMDERSAVTRPGRQFRHFNMAFGVAVGTFLFLSLSPIGAQDTSFGQRLFQDKADCQFCHGIDGDGRGDPRSPGQAANLHKTILNREQLIEVITCGRPGTEMPHFDRYCYGRSAAELGADTPHDPHSTSLTKRGIEAVADYIFAKFVGK
jgi:mono/diheme cytochrome c family protein